MNILTGCHAYGDVCAYAYAYAYAYACAYVDGDDGGSGSGGGAYVCDLGGALVHFYLSCHSHRAAVSCFFLPSEFSVPPIQPLFPQCTQLQFQ